MKRVLAYALVVTTCLAGPGLPQDSDEDEESGGFLVGFLEKNLSGENRSIKVRGLDGALSSRATIEQIEVSDDEGPWLTLNGAVLDWNRAALIRGRFSVNELSAESIIITRSPNPTPGDDLPAPEAAPFALPELPVAIEIGAMEIARIELGEPVVGVAAEIDMRGKLTLAGGALDTDLAITRLDGPADVITLRASYANETRQIGLDLRVQEDSGGLIGTLLQIPERPALILTAQGDGPVEDFGADLKLATDTVERVRGRVDLTATGEDGDAIGFTAQISGDVTPLLASDFDPFFGTQTDISLAGTRFGDGRLEISDLTLAADAMQIDGSLALSAGGLPERLALDAAITPVDGGEVVLPIGGDRTALGGLTLTAALDAATGDGWTLDMQLDGLSRSDLALARASVTASGTLSGGRDGIRLAGDLAARVSGLTFPDPALGQAIGPQITLEGGFALPGTGRFTLNDMKLTGSDYSATLDARIAGLGTGFNIDGAAQAELSDLSRFAALSGQSLQGAADLTISGTGAPLGGGFEVSVEGNTTDLAIGNETLDPLLAGQTRLEIEAARGTEGLTLRSLTLDGTALQATAAGTLRSAGTELTLTAGLDDLGRILPDLPGAVTLAGSLAEQDGVWTADVKADAPGGAVADITASIPVRAGADAAFDVAVSEPAGGPISRMLRLPDAPSVALTAKGAGPLDDFAADITLATNEQPRLTGQVSLRTRVDADQDEQEGQISFAADLNGDVTPLLEQQYRSFFGTRSELALRGQRAANGQLDIETLRLRTSSLSIDGALGLGANGLPTLVALNGTVTPEPGQTEVLLPVPGDPITLRQGRITADLNTAVSPNWDLGLAVDGLAHSQFLITRLAARANGQLTSDDPLRLLGQMRVGVQGLSLSDPALQSAIGPSLTVESGFELPGDDSLTLSNLSLQGADYTATARATVSDLSGAALIDGLVDLSLSDLARFAPLASVDLSGSLDARLSGTATPSSQMFDLELGALGRDLATGIAQADAVLTGETKLALDVTSRVGGVTINSFALDGTALTARAAGALGRVGSDMLFSAAIDDMARVIQEFPGPLTLEGSARQSGADWDARLSLDGPTGSFLRADGALKESGAAEVAFDGQLGRLERFLPDFPGTLTAKGKAQRDGGVWTIDADASGPADITANVVGQYDEQAGTADVTTSGTLELGAANRFIAPLSVQGGARFDLALQGPPSIESLNGVIEASGVSVAIPAIQNALQNLQATIQLQDGQATLGVSADVRTGGGLRVSGPVSLAAPFDGSIAVDILDVVLTDQVSYTTTAAGQINYGGPLVGNGRLSGRIDIGETEINIAAAGGGVSSAPIPELVHQNEPGAVYITRKRAGLVASESDGSSGPDIGLDITISAPNRIFVRGRGLDSELGGNILIGGSTQNIAPSGKIELLRGFMEIFGRRLELSKGQVTLQGSLQPYLEFAATSSTQDGTATLEILGEPTDLDINIFSDPERPPEEALAMLIFGNQFSELSPLKIAQVAASIVRLQGGGEGGLQTARDTTGADSVSLAEDSGGLPSLGLGGYVADNVYTDLSVNSQGDTELNINLGVTDNLTLKGTVDSFGDSGVGIFFDREY